MLELFELYADRYISSGYCVHAHAVQAQQETRMLSHPTLGRFPAEVEKYVPEIIFALRTALMWSLGVTGTPHDHRPNSPARTHLLEAVFRWRKEGTDPDILRRFKPVSYQLVPVGEHFVGETRSLWCIVRVRFRV